MAEAREGPRGGRARDPFRETAGDRRVDRLALGADEDGKVTDAYGVWVEKSMYGKKYMGIVRSTVVVAADGTVKAVFPKVQPAAHAKLVLDALKEP